MEVSPQARDLLEAVTDSELEVKVRANAAEKLGELRERATVGPLLMCLPGGGDLLTFEIVIALGKIGDYTAVKTLE